MLKLLVLSVAMALVLARPDDGHYDTKYDDIDVDSLASNERLVKQYNLCFLDKGTCTAEAKFFKEIAPEALETDCAKCTPKQRQLIRKIMLASKAKDPEGFVAVKKAFDPENKYDEQIKKFLTSTD